jgi:EAL and modified HD-GYP domain-containing signal transduction protein
MLDDTMENLMTRLPLSDNLKKALVHNEGELYPFLNIARCYERGDWEGFSKIKDEISLNDEKLPEYFLEAVTWADVITAIN